MAWQMNYTDSQIEENYPNSYWNIALNNSEPRPSKTGRFVFYGYVDAAHNGKRIIGQKSYQINAADYAALVQQPLPNPLPENVTTPEGVIAYQLYTYSKTKLDTPDGNGGFKSFFDDAEQV